MPRTFCNACEYAEKRIIWCMRGEGVSQRVRRCDQKMAIREAETKDQDERSGFNLTRVGSIGGLDRLIRQGGIEAGSCLAYTAEGGMV